MIKRNFRLLARILVALSFDDKPVTAADLGATGAMAALLKDAIKPNLVQTTEAERDIKRIYSLGYDKLPIGVAKTSLSLSDDPDCLGACTGFKITISAVHIILVLNSVS